LHITYYFTPSVFLPESFAPSAENYSLSRVLCHYRSSLPESFRGGCSFGAKILVSPDKGEIYKLIY